MSQQQQEQQQAVVGSQTYLLPGVQGLTSTRDSNSTSSSSSSSTDTTMPSVESSSSTHSSSSSSLAASSGGSGLSLGSGLGSQLQQLAELHARVNLYHELRRRCGIPHPSWIVVNNLSQVKGGGWGGERGGQGVGYTSS